MEGIGVFEENVNDEAKVLFMEFLMKDSIDKTHNANFMSNRMVRKEIQKSTGEGRLAIPIEL